MINLDILKNQTKEKLGAQYESFIFDAILEYVLRMPRIKFIGEKEVNISDEELLKFNGLISDFLKGKPLAQLLGFKEFYGLKFEVNENVLIPRPETELLVDLGIKWLNENRMKNARILDVGCGSGNIVISMCHQLKDIQGIGVDISKDALNIAKRNAVLNEVDERIEFKESNLLTTISGKFDVVFANLPYIGVDRFNFVAKDVARFEPEIALYGGSDGLDLYRKLFKQILELDSLPGLFLGEFGFGQEELMQELLKSNFVNFDFEILNDLANIPRVFKVEFRK